MICKLTGHLCSQKRVHNAARLGSTAGSECVRQIRSAQEQKDQRRAGSCERNANLNSLAATLTDSKLEPRFCVRAGPHTLKPELRRGLESRQRLVISERRPSLTLSLYCSSTHTHSLGHTCRASTCVSGKATIWVKPHLSMTLFQNHSPYNQLDSSWALHQCWLKFKASFFLVIHSHSCCQPIKSLVLIHSIAPFHSLTSNQHTGLSTFAHTHLLGLRSSYFSFNLQTLLSFQSNICARICKAPCIYFFPGNCSPGTFLSPRHE